MSAYDTACRDMMSLTVVDETSTLSFRSRKISLRLNTPTQRPELSMTGTHRLLVFSIADSDYSTVESDRTVVTSSDIISFMYTCMTIPFDLFNNIYDQNSAKLNFYFCQQYKCLEWSDQVLTRLQNCRIGNSPMTSHRLDFVGPPWVGSSLRREY